MTPRTKLWVVSALSLVVVLLGLALGQWQLRRAAQKIALQDGISLNAALPALDNQMWQGRSPVVGNLYRRVQLRGRWLAAATLFLDNRGMGGRMGMVVVTPLQLETGGAVVLVERGWVARNFLDRTSVPQIPSAAGVVEIQGIIDSGPVRHFALGGPETGRIRQNLDLKAFAAEFGVDLALVSVRQTGNLQDGLLREWPRPDVGVDKHYGYAFQWFALSGLVAIYYVWFQIVKRFRK